MSRQLEMFKVKPKPKPKPPTVTDADVARICEAMKDCVPGQAHKVIFNAANKNITVQRLPIGYIVQKTIDPAGWVYFVRAGERVKIGYARNYKTRMKELQTGCPYSLTLLMALEAKPERERELHREFAAHRVQGEWFHLEGYLSKYLDGYYLRQRRGLAK